MTSTCFPTDAFAGVTVFDAPVLHLAAVEVRDHPLAEMPALMDATFPEIFGVLASVGAEIVGPAVAFHRRMPTDTADLAVGVAVARPIGAPLALTSGRQVTAVECGGGPVAATTYLGPYEGLGDAWGRFMAEVSASGHTPSATFLEVYVSNPMETASPSELRTDLIVFLA